MERMEQVELFEQERASNYNSFVDTWIPNYATFLAQLPLLLSSVNQKELLVVGCGTGNEMACFVQAPETWKITGVDPSPDMIQQAKEKFNTTPNIHLVEGTLSQLDIQQQYHAATLLLVLHFMADDGSKLHLLQEIAARLSSGAPLVLLDITGNKLQLQQNLAILSKLLPKELDELQVQHRLQRIEEQLFAVSEERLIELCTAAGFEPPLRFFQSSIYMGWWTRKLDHV